MSGDLVEMLRLANQKVAIAYRAKNPNGITLAQFALLSVLEHGPMTALQIQKAIQMDRATTFNLLERLLLLELVTRKGAMDSSRAGPKPAAHFLSRKGRAALKVAVRAVHEIQPQMLVGIHRVALPTFLSSLRILATERNLR